MKALFSEMARRFPGAVLAFDSCNSKGANMMRKTWLKEAGITDVGAYFSMEDEKELEGWSENFGPVTSKSYMRGYRDINQEEGPKSNLARTTMMVLAVTLHNIPEGMAVGVVYAGVAGGSDLITVGGALALSLGIAIQNFPEGAIVSMPLRGEGMSKGKTFWYGVLSGAVEPVAAVITIFAFSFVTATLPYMLAFAAGAMMYVVVEELIPEMSEGEHSNWGTIAFSIGFVVMMVLDVALG